MRASVNVDAQMKPGKRARFATCALALVLGASLVSFLAPADAYADVRKSDLIAGKSVEERGVAAIKCPSIDAEFAMLVDSDGFVYFERNADVSAQIASVTKVMTAVVAMDEAPADVVVTVSAAAAAVGESSAHLQEGDSMSLETALKALMLPSGNDAAYAIAESVGATLVQQAKQEGASITAADGSTVDLNADDAGYRAFVAAMNAKAGELGCENSLFTNPHGLDDGEWADELHSCASDVAKIVAHAMSDESFRSIVSTDAATIQVTRDGATANVDLESTDALLGVYEGACGVKTGYTDLAGSCFAGAVSKEGKTLYSVVLHSTSDVKRFEDTTTLWDWAYDNLVSYPLASSAESTSMNLGGQTREVPVIAYAPLASWIDKTVKVTLADPDASVEVFALNGNVSQEISLDEIAGSVAAGDVVGRAVFYQNNEVVASADLIACEDVPAPGVLEGIGIWWDRLVRGFTGQPTCADAKIINSTPLIYDKQSTYAS